MNQKKKYLLLKNIGSFLLLVFLFDIIGTPALRAAEGGLEVPIDIDSASSTDTISMSFDGALLKDVLLLFSQQSGLNFIASQDVESKKVTVYFENVTPKDALDSIVTANGLSYSKKAGSDIFIVYPASKAKTAELVTKVIRLKYMRLSTSPLDVGGQVTISGLKTSAAGSSSSGSGSSSSSSDSSSGSSGSSSPSSSSSSSSSSSNGADKIAEKLISSQGKVTMDLATNSLIITDTAESIAAIEKVLLEIDVPPTQVVLEVHIMEVSKSLISNVGIEWGGNDGAFGTVAGGFRTTNFPLRGLNDAQVITAPVSSQDLTDFAGAAAGDASAVSTMSFGTINANAFTATLHFIQNDSRTKILARPRVLTQNNEAALISLVTNAAIGQSTSTSATGASSTDTDRSDVGVTMRMTPQINADDTVSLFLEPSVSTIGASNTVSNTSDPTTRLVRTMARVKNDQTLVIGGLIDAQDNLNRRKIPFLGDLPLVGKAFHYDADDGFDRELVVFVTPHIVRGSTSVGNPSATAKGEDVAVRRMLDQFMDREMDNMSGSFQGFEKTKREFFTKEETLVRDSEQLYSNPVVEKQMTQALDSLSPQVVDRKISQTLDSMNPKK